MKTRIIIAAAASVFATILPIAAYAQLEEIVVTAQRREASLQEVPASVTALTSAILEQKQILNTVDLQTQVPNLFVSANTGTANASRLFLRGIGEDESRGAVDQAVGVYVDGVYIGRSVGSLVDLVDIDRVEVLRGPQGTLYGRNSNGGAIRYYSKQPDTEESSFEIGGTVGSDSRVDGKLTANWAISDSTALRASVLSRNRDGFHELNPNGDFAGQGRNVGELSNTAFRIALGHNFNDAWSLTAAVDWTEDKSDPIPDSAAPPNDADNDLFTIEPLPGTTCSSATPTNFQPIGCFLGYSSKVESQGLGVTITGDLGNHLFRSRTGYREMEDSLASRIGFVYFQATDQDQLSQEFSLTSEYDGPFNWLGGVYYYTEDVQLDSTFVFDFSVGVDTTSYAAFVHGTYDFTDALTVRGGLRYTDEERDVVSSNVTFETGDGTWSATRNLDYSKTTYSFAIDYRFTEKVMAYFSLASGFKSGGASPDCFSPTACFLPVEEEEVDTWEVGLRSDLIDDVMRLNLTYFFSTYEGLQIGATVPGLGFTRFNVDETEIQGIELETVIQITENLTLNAMAGWLEGEYTQVTDEQAGGLTNDGVPCPGGVATVECALGLELKNAPTIKGTIGANYNYPLTRGALDFGFDFTFEDDSWGLVANSPDHALTQVGTLLNARFAYTADDNQWQVALWGRNLLDETYSRAATAGSFTQYASPPLEWGVDARFRF